MSLALRERDLAYQSKSRQPFHDAHDGERPLPKGVMLVVMEIDEFPFDATLLGLRKFKQSHLRERAERNI